MLQTLEQPPKEKEKGIANNPIKEIKWNYKKQPIQKKAGKEKKANNEWNK